MSHPFFRVPRIYFPPDSEAIFFDKPLTESVYTGPETNGKRSDMEYFLCVIGMVMIVEGLPYFAFPEKMKDWVQKVMEMPDGSLRGFGLLLMLAGLILVYFGRS